jgi:hypothetical protein
MIGTYFQGNSLTALFIDAESTSSANFIQRNHFEMEKTYSDRLTKTAGITQNSKVSLTPLPNLIQILVVDLPWG